VPGVPACRLEPFRPDHGDEQVDDQADGDDANKDVFHGLELSTRVGVNDADDEESDG
jgi:hypothetical protein